MTKLSNSKSQIQNPMALLDLFRRLGLFIQKDFLESEFCTKYLAEIPSITATPALVLPKTEEKILVAQLSENHRKTEQLQVSEKIELLIQQRLLAVKPILENHFDINLTGFQKPCFYRYTEGSFFSSHQDRSDRPDAPEFIKQRRISVIIFLNHQSLEPIEGNYCGGNLLFYGLIDNPKFSVYGFPFQSTAGMLIAFTSDIWHEVKPVTYGARYTIVSWFF